MKSLRFLPVILMFLLQGCEIYLVDDHQFQTPRCDIISVVKVNGNYSTPPKFRILIENYVSNSTAYDIACEIEMFAGNILVDRTYVDYGTLLGKETAIGEAFVPTLISHAYYNKAVVTLSWFDEDGDYYEKVYYY